MKKRNLLLRFVLIAFAVVVLSGTVFAQADRSLIFMDLVPQRNQVNPAFVPDYQLYAGIPFLSSVKVGFENTIHYDDIFIKRGDSLVLDRDHILNSISDESRVNINSGEEYFAFGMRHGENYFHFRIADVGQSQVMIKKDMLRFLLYGNGSSEFLGKNVNIGGSAVNLSYYREYALGYARNVIPGLTAGVTLKYLQGIANFSSQRTNFSLHTSEEDFTITATSDVNINMSVPGIGSDEVKAGDFLPNIRNSGFAIDLGATYQVDPKINVWASLLNLGSIGWKENLRNYQTTDPDKTVVFEGFDINDYFVDNSLDSEHLDDVLDSIADEFGIAEKAEKYRTRLPAKLNLGAGYAFTDDDLMNVLVRTQFFQGYSQTTFSVAYTRMLGKQAQIMISNTFYKSSVLNPGLGVAGNIGPVQLYLMAENFIAPLMLNRTNVFVFRFGVNLAFAKKTTTEKLPTPVD
ncbi:MAG: DUF5723 family protein [Bacteroidales bacterium]|jgi:hypothetical protein|nr:DUF5723 family protein [Bacteroidales bacterium]MDD4742850.1 DUF5723 family protein [Bacteroidales bacterium]MDY0333951.1 DUF5723 family protein [Bacteroidales bacterium]